MRLRFYRTFLLAGLVLIFFASVSSADAVFYQCEDRDGGVYFKSDQPSGNEQCLRLGDRGNRESVDGKVRKYFAGNSRSARIFSNNVVGNSEKAISSFNAKLKTLSEPVTIYFVGDSHIHSGDLMRGFIDGLSADHPVEKAVLCLHKTKSKAAKKKGRKNGTVRASKDFPADVPRICAPLDEPEQTAMGLRPARSKVYPQSPGHGPVRVYGYGISGKTFDYFSGSTLFEGDLRVRRPDLLVVMLGTNDAFARPERETVKQNIHNFLQFVRRTSPATDIVFITPPDSFFKDGHNNNYISLVGQELRTIAGEQGAAYWDLYRVMGGAGAMPQWRDKSLSQKDLIHFLADGYIILGRLFSQALITSGNIVEQ